MNKNKTRYGYFRNGLPYATSGQGSKPLLIFQGLMFENKPQSGMLFGYGFLEQEYTLFSVLRKPGQPRHCTLKAMAEDYADLIREEFHSPLDIIGVSTGGSIAQYFAADHPELLRRLVIHSSAHSLGEAGKRLQLELARLAASGEGKAAFQAMMRFILPKSGIWSLLNPMLTAMLGGLLAPNQKADLSDLITTIEAEDQHAFLDRLHEIKAPTLVIAGSEDPFYSPELFRETAAGIPDARLVLYPKMRHPATGRRFSQEVMEFLAGKPSTINRNLTND
ncbi:MAG: alpha/beta hydrolase [Spirochaetes bacterium]|nr:alpha/beta hydrolase [Spirochaetota bacterium]MBU0955163.1 alpha/beta hydrolase [Spirochaetota bacterium]